MTGFDLSAALACPECGGPLYGATEPARTAGLCPPGSPLVPQEPVHPSAGEPNRLSNARLLSRCEEPAAYAWQCAGCPAAYPAIDGIPLLFPKGSAPAPSALYDRIAAEYDDAIPSHVAGHYLARRVGLITREMQSGSVLDVCCGTGRLVSALAERGYAAAGVDASLNMLRVFKRQHPAAMAVAGNAAALPFLNDSFDFVVSVAALHHIAAPDLVASALAEMYRVTRPGGRVLVWDHNVLNPYWPIIMARVPQDNGEERLVPLAEVERGLRAAGCRQIEHRRLGFTPDFLPRPALGIWRRLEAVAEATPLLRELAAHNVVLARKG